MLTFLSVLALDRETEAVTGVEELLLAGHVVGLRRPQALHRRGALLFEPRENLALGGIGQR